MPDGNKEISRTWELVYVDYIEGPRGGWAVMSRFEVTSPTGEEKSVRPIYTMEFVDDYFRIPGDENITRNRIRILREKEDLFKAWGLVKIEELIDRNALEEEPQITRENFAWASKIEKGYLQPSSHPQDTSIFIYTPERKIGFK